MDSFSTSKQKTVDSTSMTTSSHNETLDSESRSVLLDVTTPPFHQNLSSSQKDHHLSGAFQIFQVPAARYADGLEQYLPKDPVARMEFEQADLDDIIMCTLLDSTL